VCLGAGITSTTGFPVKTVVENRRLVLDKDGVIGTDRAVVDGEILSTDDFEKSKSTSSYAYLEGVAGYVFLEKADVAAEKYTETHQIPYTGGGDNKPIEPIAYEKPKRFFKLTVEHGANPKGATYAYATLPYATEEETELYAKSGEVEVISNTTECQAVRKKSIGFTSYVFYKAGTCEEMSVSEPCIVTLRDGDGEREISVCDPTMKLEKLEIKVNKDLHSIKSDDRASYCGGTVSVDMHRSVGRPIRITFAI
jgi:hyaluronate lyase